MYPKVLILNQPFNKNTGGGITLTNLFSGWDKDKIAVVCTGHLLGMQVDTQVCDTYYQLGEKEHRFIFPFSLLQRKFASGLKNLPGGPLIKNSQQVRRVSLRHRLVNNVVLPAIKYFGLQHGISKIQLSDDLCNWLNDFAPDVIYAQAQNLEDLLFCSLIHQHLKKPLVFHMMDDWPSLIKDNWLLSKIWFKKIDRQFRTLLDSSSLLLSISDGMADEYKERYSHNFISFHNPVDLHFWGRFQRQEYDLKEQPTLLYAGRVGEGIDSSLVMVAEAVSAVNKKTRSNLNFVIQTKTKPGWVDEYDCVLYRPPSNYEDLPKTFSGSDFLILPYDFSRKSLSFIRFSMPTKVSEYMVSGTPIIVFAPDNTALVQYSRRNKIAHIVSTNSAQELANQIVYLLRNKEYRRTLAVNAKRVAGEKHNVTKIRSEFREAISAL